MENLNFAMNVEILEADQKNKVHKLIFPWKPTIAENMIKRELVKTFDILKLF